MDLVTSRVSALPGSPQEMRLHPAFPGLSKAAFSPCLATHWQQEIASCILGFPLLVRFSRAEINFLLSSCLSSRSDSMTGEAVLAALDVFLWIVILKPEDAYTCLIGQEINYVFGGKRKSNPQIMIMEKDVRHNPFPRTRYGFCVVPL